MDWSACSVESWVLADKHRPNKKWQLVDFVLSLEYAFGTLDINIFHTLKSVHIVLIVNIGLIVHIVLIVADAFLITSSMQSLAGTVECNISCFLRHILHVGHLRQFAPIKAYL